LTALENLTVLDLSATNTTDAELVELAKLKRLKTLRLVLSETTPAGADKLKESLPDCEVVTNR
jgi:hypothetical protein